MISEVPHVDLFLPWLYTVYLESQSKNAQKVPENDILNWLHKIWKSQEVVELVSVTS